MQDAAFRYASQSLRHNNSLLSSSEQLWAIVDTQLGGTGRAHADLSSGHIAAYMRAKAFFGQLQQRDALFDIETLSAAAAVHKEAGSRTRWLAHTLVGLQRDADRLAATTPMFASEIAAQVRRTAAIHPELKNLSLAMREVAMRSDLPDDEHTGAEEYPRTSFS